MEDRIKLRNLVTGSTETVPRSLWAERRNEPQWRRLFSRIGTIKTPPEVAELEARKAATQKKVS